MQVDTLQPPHHSSREARGHHPSKRSVPVRGTSSPLPRQENVYGSVDLLRRAPRPLDTRPSTATGSTRAIPISSSPHGMGMADAEGYRHASGLSQHLQVESSSPGTGGSHKFDIKRLLSKPASSASSSPSSSASAVRTFPPSPSPRPRAQRITDFAIVARTPEPLSALALSQSPSIKADPAKPPQYQKREHSLSPFSKTLRRKHSAGNFDSTIVPPNGNRDSSPYGDVRNRSLPRNHRMKGPSEELPNPISPPMALDACITSDPRAYKFSHTQASPLSPPSTRTAGRPTTPIAPVASPSTSSLLYSITPASQIALEYQKTQAALEEKKGPPPGSEHEWDSERSQMKVSPETRHPIDDHDPGASMQGLTRKGSNKLLKRPKKTEPRPGPSSKTASPLSSADSGPKQPEATSSVAMMSSPSGDLTRSGDVGKERRLRPQASDEQLARRCEPSDGSPTRPMEHSKSGDTLPVRHRASQSQSRLDKELPPSPNSFVRLVRKLSFSALRRGSTQEEPIPPVPSIPSSISSIGTSSQQHLTPIRRESTSTGDGSVAQPTSPSCAHTPPSPSAVATSPADSGYLSRIFKRRPSQGTTGTKAVTDTTSAKSVIPRSSASTHLSSRLSSRPSLSSQNISEYASDPVPPLPTSTPGKYNTERIHTPPPSQSLRGATPTNSNMLFPQGLDRPPSRQPSSHPPSSAGSLTPTPTLTGPPSNANAPTSISAEVSPPVSQSLTLAPAPLRKRNSLRKRVPSFRMRTAPDADGIVLLPPPSLGVKMKRPRTAGGDGSSGRSGFWQKSAVEPIRFRSNSLDGSGNGMGKTGAMNASTTSIAFLGDNDRSAIGPKTQDEKHAMWDELMRRSDRAGGTLHASVGGVKLASDELEETMLPI